MTFIYGSKNSTHVKEEARLCIVSWSGVTTKISGSFHRCGDLCQSMGDPHQWPPSAAGISSGTSITCPLFAGLDHLHCGPLTVVSQAQVAHEVDEAGGGVVAQTELTGGVVEGEGVVKVVESFTNSSESNEAVFSGIDVLVVGFVPIHVRSAVDKPRNVERDGVAQDGGQEVGVPQALSPEIPWHHSGNQKAHDQN